MHYLVVETDFAKISKEYDAKVDEKSFVDLLKHRNTDAKIGRGIEHNFLGNPEIKQLIAEHYAAQKKAAELEVKESEEKLHEVKEKLKAKETKTALTLKTRLENKIKKAKWQTEKDPFGPLFDYDKRIYPLSLAGVIIKENNELVIKPMRFQMQSKLYKAKRESLTSEYFERISFHSKKKSQWQSYFGKTHGILVVQSFHEYNNEHKSVGFSQREPILVPCLYEEVTNKKVTSYNFAIVTAEAPQAVLHLGYHRSPVALKSAYINAWLSPEGQAFDDLQKILQDNNDEAYQAAA